jgi:DNA modification methylase
MNEFFGCIKATILRLTILPRFKTWSTVWDIPPKANLDHAVAFPVEIPLRCIKATSKVDDEIFDPFVGSGTTIIAGEMTARAVHAIELLPAYVDVCVKRWQAFTGKLAQLEGGGTFEEIEKARHSEWNAMWSKPFDRPDLLGNGDARTTISTD